MGSSPGLKIVAGVGVALFVAILYTRSGHQSREAPAPERATVGGEAAGRSGQLEQRLQQLREAHDRASRQHTSAGAGAKIEAQSEVAPRPRVAVRKNVPPAPNAVDTNETAAVDLDPDDIPTLKRTALTDPDPERRLAAITLLGSSEDPEVLSTLAQTLSDEDDEVRMAAIQSLSDLTGDAPVDLLSKVAVNDPSADNRYEALQALSDIGGDRASAAIHKALNDPDEDVRSLAEGMVDDEDTDGGN